ncbi:glycosyltransferase, partial [Bifidobacterium bifidum LMG 13195]
MSDILQENGFRVLTPESEESSALSLSDFDIIWVQHETLPVQLL